MYIVQYCIWSINLNKKLAIPWYCFQCTSIWTINKCIKTIKKYIKMCLYCVSFISFHCQSKILWGRFRSLCFKWFWVSLEMQGLVYKKKNIFDMLNRFYLIWPFILQKIPPPFIRVEFFFSRNRQQRVSKEAQFCTDFKKVHKSCINKCLKNFPWTPYLAKKCVSP